MEGVSMLVWMNLNEILILSRNPMGDPQRRQEINITYVIRCVPQEKEYDLKVWEKTYFQRISPFKFTDLVLIMAAVTSFQITATTLFAPLRNLFALKQKVLVGFIFNHCMLQKLLDKSFF